MILSRDESLKGVPSLGVPRHVIAHCVVSSPDDQSRTFLLDDDDITMNSEVGLGDSMRSLRSLDEDFKSVALPSSVAEVTPSSSPKSSVHDTYQAAAASTIGCYRPTERDRIVSHQPAEPNTIQHQYKTSNTPPSPRQPLSREQVVVPRRVTIKPRLPDFFSLPPGYDDSVEEQERKNGSGSDHSAPHVRASTLQNPDTRRSKSDHVRKTTHSPGVKSTPAPESSIWHRRTMRYQQLLQRQSQQQQPPLPIPPPEKEIEGNDPAIIAARSSRMKACRRFSSISSRSTLTSETTS